MRETEIIPDYAAPVECTTTTDQVESQVRDLRVSMCVRIYTELSFWAAELVSVARRGAKCSNHASANNVSLIRLRHIMWNLNDLKQVTSVEYLHEYLAKVWENAYSG